jgi:hypothetical protein
VVADMAKLSVGRETYYTRELATDHRAYLSGHGESPSTVVRRRRQQPRAAGRSLRVRVPGYVRGSRPHEWRAARPPPWPQCRAAFGLVLRPTKSVSVLYGVRDPATDRAVLSAHHAELAEAVGYLDEHLGARRGHGGIQHVDGQGVLAVGFDHRTSREGDPLLRTGNVNEKIRLSFPFRDPIRWDEGGPNLINGQHRLCALRAAGGSACPVDGLHLPRAALARDPSEPPTEHAAGSSVTTGENQARRSGGKSWGCWGAGSPREPTRARSASA